MMKMYLLAIVVAVLCCCCCCVVAVLLLCCCCVVVVLLLCCCVVAVLFCCCVVLLLFAERLDYLDQCCNPQLQRLKIRVMGYNFTAMQWIKGALDSSPDALSRHPVSDSLPLDLHAERDPGNEPEVTIADIRAMTCSQESLLLHELCRHAEEDCCLQQLCHYISGNASGGATAPS